jgi:predicted ester cyclase
VTETHVGNGFPRLRDTPVSGKRVPWTQVHIFRVADGQLAEHWAVRDDYALVEAIVGAGPLVAPPRGE